MARNFMRVFKLYGKSGIIPDLPPTILYALSAPSTPDEARLAIEARTEAEIARGDHPVPR